MKKFLAVMAALAAMTAVLTGCSGNNTGSGSSSGTQSSTDASAAESTAESAPEASERTAEDLTNAVFQCIDWVSSEQITDAEIAETMLGLDLSLLDDYSIFIPMMSVHLDELIVVKPKAGSEEAVDEQLTAHFDYIKDGAAFYPEQEIAAAGAVKGKTDDGFYYIIVNQIGSQIADVMTGYQPGDEVPKLELPESDDNGIIVVPTDELGEPIYGSDAETVTAE